jgi:hypothetical protein
MILPNFLIIGAAKSGTTAIYTYIKQHPDIFMSSPKELRYFSYRGPYPEGLDEKYIHKGVTTFEEYIAHFSEVKDEKIIGEASPMYLYVPGTAERIHAVIPNVKLFAILRNPIDRAFSAYMHAIRDWLEPSSSFKMALEKEQERIEAGWGILWHYIKAGFYYEQLNRYYEIFDPCQIKVVLYNDLVKTPGELMKSIFDYLEVDPNFIPDMIAKPNVSGFPKNSKFHKFMYRLFMQDNIIKHVGRKLFSESFRRRVMVNMRLINLEKRSMPDDIRKQLKDLFVDDIRKLENLIDRDLAFWLE